MIPNKRILSLISHGKKISEYSNYKFKLGAIIFKGKKIISTGFNKNKTHPKANEYFKHGSVHAEIDAILHAPYDIQGSSILVCRMYKNGKPALAKPCAMCIQMMYEFGIKEVFWTIPVIPFWDHAKVSYLYDIIDKKKAFQYNNY
jgi:deoxycytidylate deaminase